ncbi:MAG TPA: septum formation initiator family protein [Streptosporangiaceae bacterium]|jgi:cell division protein FtsB
MTGLPGQRPPAPTRFTGRVAVLAVVICAIALSLAYPVREYIAQSRQIGQLEAQHQQLSTQVSALQGEKRKLTSPAYVQQQARDNLHMCMPGSTCYVIIPGNPPARRAARAHSPAPAWYQRLWQSVQQAGKTPPPARPAPPGKTQRAGKTSPPGQPGPGGQRARQGSTQQGKAPAR